MDITRTTEGKRLRVCGAQRTEAEYKQMLRLAECEVKEYKDTMRYLEIQLVRQKEQTADITKKYEEA